MMKHPIIALALLAAPCTGAEAAAMQVPGGVAVQDTINYDDYDEESALNDSTGKSRRNVATGTNVMRYVMDTRYRGYSEEFTKRWDDHLFLQVSGGFQKEIGKYGNHGLSLLGSASVAVGKQFNRFHSARLTFGGDIGYRRDLENNYVRLSAKADWLFSLSAYLDGYNPERLLDVSTVLGAGVRRVITREVPGASRTGAEVHAGLQFRFFTGPQGYLAIEPFAGAASASVDKKFNAFYGANLGFIYYIHNNLAARQRVRYMKERPAWADSTVEAGTWRTPWFVQTSAGLATINDGAGLGHNVNISVGRWLSPAIAVRVGAQLTTVPYSEETLAYEVGTYVRERQDFNYKHHNQNLDARVDAIINPFGFFKHFDWDAPFGAYLVLGGGVGYIAKNHAERYTAEQMAALGDRYWDLGEQRLRTKGTFYSAGLHLWCRVTDGLQLFLEPRYTYYGYRIPYTNVSWSKRYSDNELTLNLGLTSTYTKRRFRKVADDYDKPSIPLTVGVGGGTNLTHLKNQFDGAGLGYNFGGHVEWRFDKISSVRGSFEYLSFGTMSRVHVKYYDATGYEFTAPAGTSYSAMFKNRYNVGLASLDYLVSLTTLFDGYHVGRRFELEAFGGPAYMFLMSCNHELALDRTATATFQVDDMSEREKSCLAVNAGLKLRFNATPHIAVTLTPQLYYLTKLPQWQGLDIYKARLLEMLDLGVQYSF